jgi:hypothetical protein
MQTGHAGYLRFLAERDGTLDFGRRTLSRRETFFAALDAAPLRSTTPIDRAAYLRNLDRRRPEPGLEPRLLWLLATARANQAERFGVGLGELYGRITPESEPVRLHVTLQEIYHTRILADVVALFGVPVSRRPPGLATRALTHLMVRTPEGWQLPLVGAGEMVGWRSGRCATGVSSCSRTRGRWQSVSNTCSTRSSATSSATWDSSPRSSTRGAARSCGVSTGCLRSPWRGRCPAWNRSSAGASSAGCSMLPSGPM